MGLEFRGSWDLSLKAPDRRYATSVWRGALKKESIALVRENASSPVAGDGNQELVLACPNLVSIPSYSRVVDLVCRGRTHHSNPVYEDDTRLGPIELDDPEMNEARKRKCGKMILNHGSMRSTEKEKGVTSEHFLEAGPESVRLCLKFQNCFSIPCVGRSGGLCLFWNNNSNCYLLSYFAHHIDMEVVSDGITWRFTDCDLSDIALCGHPFTWSRGRGSNNFVEQRLDCAMGNRSRHDLFPRAKILNLVAPISDHNPILLDLESTIHIVRKSLFHFENKWFEEYDLPVVVKRSWKGFWDLEFSKRLLGMSDTLQLWGTHVMNALKLSKLELERELKRLQAHTDAVSVNLFSEVRNKLSQLIVKKDLHWHQRAKIFWFWDRDPVSSIIWSLQGGGIIESLDCKTRMEVGWIYSWVLIRLCWIIFRICLA
ncbi:hypothetical protein ACS0TY_024095 [Phlomoides rotata]